MRHDRNHSGVEQPLEDLPGGVKDTQIREFDEQIILVIDRVFQRMRDGILDVVEVGNYGLAFNWWDRLMRTNHPAYLATFDAMKARLGPAPAIPIRPTSSVLTHPESRA